MKIKKYPEMRVLKGKMREEKMTYKLLSKKLGMSVDAINNKVNGYSTFNTDEVNKVVMVLNIDPNDIHKYFFPSMLPNTTIK